MKLFTKLLIALTRLVAMMEFAFGWQEMKAGTYEAAVLSFLLSAVMGWFEASYIVNGIEGNNKE